MIYCASRPLRLNVYRRVLPVRSIAPPRKRFHSHFSGLDDSDATLLAVYGLITFATAEPTDSATLAHASGTYANSDHFANYLAMLLPLVILAVQWPQSLVDKNSEKPLTDSSRPRAAGDRCGNRAEPFASRMDSPLVETCSRRRLSPGRGEKPPMSRWRYPFRIAAPRWSGVCGRSRSNILTAFFIGNQGLTSLNLLLRTKPSVIPRVS